MRVTIRKADDMHLHGREGAMLASVLPASCRGFGRALFMPNVPSVLSPEDVVAYRREILSHGSGLEPLMTIKIAPQTTPETIFAAKAVGAVAGKLYPDGVTTGSENGVSDFKALDPVFAAMERCGMILCLHGEMPGAFILHREERFLPTLSDIHSGFPKLKIVLEHVSTKLACEAIERMNSNVAATITAHHLFLTLDDVIGSKLRPHAFCMPVAKTPTDREALIERAVSGDPKFFLGTDSAPHRRDKKECADGCAGIFSAPVALQALAQIFERRDRIERLEDFTSRFGAEFYGLPLNSGSITLLKKAWIVPELWGDVVPFMAGKILDWQIE